MESLSRYQILFDNYLENNKQKSKPHGLYAPIEYILSLGGKRLRPLLALLATEAFGNKPEDALPAALSVEVFHNFTLVHDDIMDEAPLRRGEQTVHKKWNENIGILSGDILYAVSNKLIANYK